MPSSLSASTVRTIASLLIAGILVFAFYQLLSPFLISIVSGGVIALLSRPLYQGLYKKTGITSLSAFLTLLVLAILVGLPLFLIGSLLVREVTSLAPSFYSSDRLLVISDRLVDRGLALVGQPAIDLHVNIRAYLQEALAYIGGRSSLLIGGFVGVAITLFLTLLSAFYVMQSHDSIQDSIQHFSPLQPADTALLWRRAKEVVRATVTGNLMVVGLTGLLSMADFAIFGVGAPALLGVLFGITSMVPTVGSAIVWVPVVLFQVVNGHYVAAIGITAWTVLQVLMFDNFIGPRLIEKRARLHPFLVLLGMLGGVTEFGILGLILGPTIVALGIVGMEIARRSWNPDTDPTLA